MKSFSKMLPLVFFSTTSTLLAPPKSCWYSRKVDMYGWLSGIILVKPGLHPQLARHHAEHDRDQDVEDQQPAPVMEDPVGDLADPVAAEFLRSISASWPARVFGSLDMVLRLASGVDGADHFFTSEAVSSTPTPASPATISPPPASATAE